jgi:branched-chain amino acid transport system ATP-binding protein
MLAVARALLSQPRLVLLDEPSLGLAPLIVAELFATFRSAAAETGLAMLVVEQNAALALDLAQRAYVLDSGVVVADGRADELRDDPAIRQAYLGRRTAGGRADVDAVGNGPTDTLSKVER